MDKGKKGRREGRQERDRDRELRGPFQTHPIPSQVTDCKGLCRRRSSQNRVAYL